MNNNTIKDKFIVDAYNSVYEYDAEEGAYMFLGKLNGDTLEDFVRDYEEQMTHEEMYNHAD
jgi:hypothetical protein